VPGLEILIDRNRQFITDLYAGRATRPGFICLPPAQNVLGELGDFTTSDKPVSQWVPQVVENYHHQQALLQALGDDNVPVATLSTGTHIYAAAFGCRVHIYGDSPAAARPLVETAEQADRLKVPDIWTSPSLYRVFELGQAVRKELGQDVPLGGPDVQSGLDTACLIWRKQDLFCAMMDPSGKDSVKRLVGKCSDLLIRFLSELRREFPTHNPCHCPGVWAPPRLGPWVSNDECGSLSVAAFEEFGLPELVELSRRFGGIGMHCCADAEHQFPTLARIPGLYGFNRVAARRGYGPILDHLAGPGSPVHVLAWIDEAQIADLLARTPRGTRFIFVRFDTSPDQGRAWLERVRALVR